jgi:hypothetical protein
LDRKLAVPLALGRLWQHEENKMARSRILKDADEKDLRMLMTLADNRVRLEKLNEDIDRDPIFEDTEDMKNELDYINASIQLGILEITGELEEIQNSDEVFEEALA